MPFNVDHQFIYIHPTRTGGTSICQRFEAEKFIPDINVGMIRGPDDIPQPPYALFDLHRTALQHREIFNGADYGRLPLDESQIDAFIEAFGVETRKRGKSEDYFFKYRSGASPVIERPDASEALLTPSEDYDWEDRKFFYKMWREYTISNAFESAFDDYFKFAFVRNPWARALSQFLYRKKHMDLNFAPAHVYSLSFSDFIEYLYSADYSMGIRHNLPVREYHFGNQLKWLVDEEGAILMDFVGHLEHLQSDFDYVCCRIGIPPQKLPHVNRTDHKPYWEYYTPKARDLVAEHSAVDIEHFGYEFGSAAPINRKMLKYQCN